MKMRRLATRHMLPFLLLVPATAPAGAPTIELPVQSPRHREIILHEQWRIGAGDEDPVLGPICDAVAGRDGHLVVAGRLARHEGPAYHFTDYVASLSAAGAARHCYGTHEGGTDNPNEITVDELGDWSNCRSWALGRGGEVYFAPDRDAVIDGLRFNGRGLHVYCPTRGTAAPGTKTFDVLDAEGRFLETRTVRLPGCGAGDELFLLEDGRAICVKNLDAAMVAAEAGWQVQVGDKRHEAKESETGGDLEVILFAPEPCPESSCNNLFI